MERGGAACRVQLVEDRPIGVEDVEKRLQRAIDLCLDLLDGKVDERA
jgi:hypothetical protein